jgi:heptosyltransferase-3
VIHPSSRREKKLWDKEKFGRLINLLIEKDLSVVVTSGPDLHEIEYVEEILKKVGNVDKKVLNVAGKTSLLGLAALIKGSKFFIGLDSVASHIAASVDKESITLFGPSNPVNWKPWSDKARIIAREDLYHIEIEDVMSLVDEMPVK